MFFTRIVAFEIGFPVEAQQIRPLIPEWTFEKTYINIAENLLLLKQIPST